METLSVSYDCDIIKKLASFQPSSASFYAWIVIKFYGQCSSSVLQIILYHKDKETVKYFFFV